MFEVCEECGCAANTRGYFGQHLCFECAKEEEMDEQGRLERMAEIMAEMEQQEKQGETEMKEGEGENEARISNS